MQILPATGCRTARDVMADKEIKTVADLIERLQALPPDSRVLMMDNAEYTTDLFVSVDTDGTVWICQGVASDDTPDARPHPQR
jgi:hypothetical protein